MTKFCVKCGEERPARGFSWHVESCKGKIRFPKQAAILSPEAYARYLRKAQGG